MILNNKYQINFLSLSKKKNIIKFFLIGLVEKIHKPSSWILEDKEKTEEINNQEFRENQKSTEDYFG